MTSTKVETRDNRELRRVEAVDGDGEIAGFAEYQISVDGNTFDFTHTEVDERFAGKGVGSSLAAGVMDFAREEGVKIQPTCSFIRSYMDKHEETNDLRAPEQSDETDESDESDRDTDQSDGDTDQDTDRDDSDDESDDDSDESAADEGADVDSPDAGPADAKAAGSGGATDEEGSRA